MSLIKFWLNQHYDLGGDVIWRISRWPPWQPSWMSEWNKFSSSESPCLPNASDQVSALSDLPFESRCRFKIFKLGYWNGTNLVILNLHVTQMLPTKFELNPTYCLGAEVFEDFHGSHRGGHLEYWYGTNLAVLNLHVSPMPYASDQASALSDLLFESRCRFKIFKLVTMAAILDIGTERI